MVEMEPVTGFPLLIPSGDPSVNHYVHGYQVFLHTITIGFELSFHAGESTTQRKDTIEENGSRNVVRHGNLFSSINGNVTISVTANAPIETKVGFRGKRAFQMSAHEVCYPCDPSMKFGSSSSANLATASRSGKYSDGPNLADEWFKQGKYAHSEPLSCEALKEVGKTPHLWCTIL
ncbi:hypothetical protein M8C21_015702 [Ambrosia artemisiifolia]|uniref:Uncharacterized protein n=1 Tax=Ambrosia artemisiifolia TaxID=4212 RepID=A0AAD5G560_AMBAR|nr:hypothetical protein M8C21_015702 [Ambrosia artemisiifolia]